MAKLEARSLRKQYRNKLAVENVSLQVSSSEIIGLLGPNGAGKTTCFYMIVGLLRADGGDIFLDGKRLTDTAMHLSLIHISEPTRHICLSRMPSSA